MLQMTNQHVALDMLTEEMLAAQNNRIYHPHSHSDFPEN
jgi:hypothetical protein